MLIRHTRELAGKGRLHRDASKHLTSLCHHVEGNEMVDLDQLANLILDGANEELTRVLRGLADVNCTTDGNRWNLLHIAMEPIRETVGVDTLRILIDAGVDPNSQDVHGYTPLHYAARKNDVAGIEFLCRNEADPNVINGEGVTPMQVAVRRLPISPETVRALVEHGGDPDAGEKGTARKMMEAVSYEDKDAILEIMKRKS